MLQLEKEMRWEIQTSYYYSNLNCRSWRFLCHKLGLGDKKRITYERFKAIKLEKDHYDRLLEVWREYGRYSVKTRGHAIQDIIALLIAVGFLVCILLTKCYYPWALLAFLIIPLLITVLGRHYGWWLRRYS